MTEAALAALASAGAATLVNAMVTDAWRTARTGMRRLFNRSEATDAEAIAAQLDYHAALISDADEPASARQGITEVWRLELVRLLKRHPEAEADLRAVIDDIERELPAQEPAGASVQMNLAQDNGQVFGVQDGNLFYFGGAPQNQPARD